MRRGGNGRTGIGSRSRARLFGGLAVLLSATTLVTFAVSNAGASAPPPINVTGDHVVCNTVTGAMQFATPLVNGGTATTNAVTVKGRLDGCTDTDNPAVTLALSTFSATLTGSTNDCSALSNVNTFPSNVVTINWHTAPSTPKLTTSTSSVTLSELTGAEYGADWANYIELQSGTAFETAPLAVTGAFSGSDGGVASKVDIVTSLDDLHASEAACNGKGVKALNFAIGQVALG